MRPEERPEISTLPLFAKMNEEQRERIFAASLVQVFPPQLTLFDVGQKPDFLYVLIDGLVELHTSNGMRDTVVEIAQPVSTFILAALITDQPFLMSARTLEASRIMMIPGGILRNVIKQDSALMQETMRELAVGYRNMVRALTDMKLRQSTERLGNYILLQSHKQNGQINVQLRSEKKLLASLLGMTPENLSRAFSALSKYGVSIDGADITITDYAALVQFARPDAY